jgi:polysaccharide pyruvyl transferase CsaB
MPPVIGIIGSYGGLNLGDEAILASAVAELRAAAPDAEIVVFSRNAEHTRQHHDVDRTVNVRCALRGQVRPEVARLDLLLLGGGGILYDTEAQVYLREVELAHEAGVPTFAYAIGVGPLVHAMERRAVRAGLNRMAGITVREITAKRVCQEIGVTVPVEVTADPAFLLEPLAFTDEMLAKEAIPSDGRLVAFSIRERGPAAPGLDASEPHQLVAATADYCMERFGATVVFVPMERADRRESHAVLALMSRAENAFVLRHQYHPRHIMGLVGRCELAVGMRLHFLIFAAVTGTPMMALPYASKVGDLLNSLGVSDWVKTDEAHVGVLLANLDRLWDNRDGQMKAVAERLPALQALARRTASRALAVIGLDPGPDAAPEQSGEDLASPQITY